MEKILHHMTQDLQIQNQCRKRNFKFVEAFSGPGGLSLGLEEAGFELLYAFDYDEASVNTHNKNLGNKCHLIDIRDLDPNKLRKELNLNIGDLDLVAGGPPCQGFSKQKKGAHLGDSRNELVIAYGKFIQGLLPKFFILENVAIFGQKRGKIFIEELKSELRNYNFISEIYNSAAFGLAQKRERYIVVGIRKDLEVGFTKPIFNIIKPKTIRDVIGDLPSPPADYSPHPTIPNHQKAKITSLNEKRFSFVPPGGGWKDIPRNLRLPCHNRVDTTKGGWPDVYGRLEWTGVCPTITGGFDNFSRGRFGHPEENRALTAREASRLQGFPDDFIFSGNRGEVRSQIGNAVPPPLAKAIGIEILRSLLVLDNLPMAENGPRNSSQALLKQLELAF